MQCEVCLAGIFVGEFTFNYVYCTTQCTAHTRTHRDNVVMLLGNLRTILVALKAIRCIPYIEGIAHCCCQQCDHECPIS